MSPLFWLDACSSLPIYNSRNVVSGNPKGPRGICLRSSTSNEEANSNHLVLVMDGSLLSRPNSDVRAQTRPMAFSSSKAAFADSVLGIVLVCAEKQMDFSDALRVVAAMQNQQAIGNRAMGKHPSDTVCLPFPSPMLRENAVTLLIKAMHPFVARAKFNPDNGAVSVDFPPKSLYQRPSYIVTVSIPLRLARRRDVRNDRTAPTRACVFNHDAIIAG